jgi:hypothetical protein
MTRGARQAIHEQRRRFDGLLCALGLATLSLYAWLALRYPLLAGLERGRANWATLGERSLAAGLLHGAVYGLLVLLYLVALRRVAGLRGTGAAAIVWGTWLAAALILLGAYPGESLDVFDYLFRGRMLAEYGASPLAVSPTPFRDRPFYRFITWRGQVDTYGPLWEYASGGVAWLVGRLGPGPAQERAALAAYVTGYRLLAISASGLCGLLVCLIVRRHTPDLATAALLAWLWNPLLLTASAIGAHNDVLLALLVLAALWLFQHERWWPALLVLMLAAHVKLTALLLLPVAGLWLARRIGWRAAFWHGLLTLTLALPLSWLLYAPLGGWATLPRMLRERTQFLAHSPADLFYRWLQEQALWAEPDARRLAIGGATLLFCLLATGLIAHLLDAPAALRPGAGRGEEVDDAALWRCSLTIILLYLLVGSFWFMPWYLLWALPVAALRPASAGMRHWTVALTLGALWSGLVADTLIVTRALNLGPTEIRWVSVGLLLAPLVVPALALARRRHLGWLRLPTASEH